MIKNNRVVYTHPAGPSRLDFEFRDDDFKGSKSYYYVRVTQRYSAAQPEADGEIAWSSPIYVTQADSQADSLH